MGDFVVFLFERVFVVLSFSKCAIGGVISSKLYLDVVDKDALCK